jgi:hypothetical protein
MARIRSIKPEFFTSLTIGSLSERARLAFIGIWTFVDDYGRAVDDARLVKAAVFPLDDRITVKAVAEVIDELVAAGRLGRYEAGGRHYFVVANWNEHQKIDRRTSSKLPPPPGEPSTNSHRDNSEDSTRMQRGCIEGSIHDQGAAAHACARPTVVVDHPAAAAAVETILTIREQQQNGHIVHPAIWRTKTRPKIADEFADRISSYLDTHPDADAREILTAGCGFDRWAVIGAGVAP